MKKPIAISITNNKMSATRPSTADQVSPNTDDLGGAGISLLFCATRVSPAHQSSSDLTRFVESGPCRRVTTPQWRRQTSSNQMGFTAAGWQNVTGADPASKTRL
jgi:hypothetical protein